MNRRCTALCLVLTGSMLLGGCAQNAPAESTNITETTAAVTETTTTVTETTAETTETPPAAPVYDFKWDMIEYEEFQRIVAVRFGPTSLKEYLMSYGGFDQEMQQMFTVYVNDHYGKEYDTVPFSTVSYFRKNLAGNLNYARQLKNYKKYSSQFLDKNAVEKSAFKNKLVMSYLIRNNIAFGDRVPADNLMQIRENVDMSKYSTKPYLKNKKKRQAGNFNNSYKYSAADLLTVLTYYNQAISKICLDYRVMPLTFNTDDPKYADDCKDVVELCNGFLQKNYGSKAPQIGEKLTGEKYKDLFGEEPLELDYIPGGVFDASKKAQKETFTIYSGNEGIKEKVTGTWTAKKKAYGYGKYKGFTLEYVIVFKDDNTGTFTTKTRPTNAKTKKQVTKVSTIDFTYQIKYGTMVEMQLSNGNKECMFFKNNNLIRLYEYYDGIRNMKTENYKKAMKQK